jgi:hypothetical protein
MHAVIMVKKEFGADFRCHFGQATVGVMSISFSKMIWCDVLSLALVLCWLWSFGWL